MKKEGLWYEISLKKWLSVIQGLQNNETKMMDGATWMATTLKSYN